MSIRRLLSFGALFLVALLVPRSALHAQTDVIRGKVTGPDNNPIERATVTVTTLTGNVSRSARTAKDGHYTVTFPGDEGDYFVTVAALGFTAKRFEIKRTADQEILIADAKLLTSATQLDAMQVNAQRQRANRNDDLRADISGSERTINPGNVSPDLMGDLAALAASMPGVQLIPGSDGAPSGFSVLGLGADQNSTTLNGLNFGGSALPRDAQTTSSLVTSPYDVSRGGFSGGQLNVRSRPGNNYINRTTSLNFDSPHLQWTDPAARSLGQQYQNVSVGGLLSGPIQTDKSFFSISYQAGRRSQDLQSLLNTDRLGLQAAGVASDSVARLLNILNASHVPGRVGGIPGSRLNDNALVFGTFDFAPPTSTTGQALNLTFNGSWNRANPASATTTELPSHSGERESLFGMLAAKHSGYFGFLLSETSLGLSESKFSGDPYVRLPNGSVLVNSSFTDLPNGVQSLAFGGNPAMNTSVATTSAQLRNQLGWFSENNKHSLKLTSELRADRYSQDMTVNELGSFTFNSLADLEAGHPASFSRQLSPRTRNTGAYIGSVALGDSYRPIDDLQLQYGLRVDGNRFNQHPTENVDVDRLFGARNDQVPNNVYFSPRLGFAWTYGTAAQVSAFQGAFRGPRAVVRGGIGILQNLPNTQAIGGVIDNTGLPSAIQQLNCIGGAAPMPDWSAYSNEAAIPDRCADGTLGSVFASTAPNVQLFAKNYQAPRSLRSNLQWNGAVLDNRFATTIDATYSRNLNQASTYDLNFTPTTQFALAAEGNRPIFANPANIVTNTGGIAATESRVSTAYSHVSELRSDMQSEAKQLMVSLRPLSFSSSLLWNATYVLSDTRERYRGFTSTSGSPLDVAWGRSTFDSKHQLMYTLNYNAFDFIRLGWYQSFRSGNPYTPVVAGDINGDGYSNDRAFIFDPAKTSDTVIANGMRALLANGSSSARACLNKQLGSVASRNSCQGPWTSTAGLSFSFNPVKVRLPQRATMSFNISNPLGAADVLLHGEDKLHGWGQSFVPTSNLLTVRGFDQTTQSFKYDVNQRFGATAVQQSAIRSPVTLTAMLRVDVGPARERQDLTQLLDRGRRTTGQKAPEAFLRSFYGNGGIMNPMVQILRQADTLELSQESADSIAILNRNYTIKLDSIWTPVVKYLSTLPSEYDQTEAYDRYRVARMASVDAMIKLAPIVKSLLNDDQKRKLPTFVTPFLDTRYLASIRSGTTGGGLGMTMMGPGAMPAIAGAAAGGGGTTTFIRIGTP
ncbi:MAG TPA: carboxypeptidase-like regulatory domain-containing protein [Gemmatimonadaceae bacterium]|jgi:hypothetical protein